MSLAASDAQGGPERNEVLFSGGSESGWHVTQPRSSRVLVNDGSRGVLANDSQLRDEALEGLILRGKQSLQNLAVATLRRLPEQCALDSVRVPVASGAALLVYDYHVIVYTNSCGKPGRTFGVGQDETTIAEPALGSYHLAGGNVLEHLRQFRALRRR